MALTKIKTGSVSDSITLTSPDINTPDIDGGTIDGTVIGGATPAAISGTTITATVANANPKLKAAFNASNYIGISHEKINVQGGGVGLIIQGNGTDRATFASGGGLNLANGDLIVASGNVGIGVVPQSGWSGGAHDGDVLQVGTGGAVYGRGSGNADMHVSSNLYRDSAGAFKAIVTGGSSFFQQSGGGFHFNSAASVSAGATASITTKVAINGAGNITTQYGNTSGYAQTSGSGGVAFVNDTGSIGSALISVTNAASGWSNFYVNRLWTSGQDTRLFQFSVNGSGVAGSIRVASASTITFNTSSDYRLKENVVYEWDATTRLKQLKPARFNFIVDGTGVTQDGFMAHEAQEVVPIAVSGTKDAMKDEDYEITPAVLDDDGVEITAAVMGTRRAIDAQGIDHSKLVPLLVKTIQELEARITTLEAGE